VAAAGVDVDRPCRASAPANRRLRRGVGFVSTTAMRVLGVTRSDLADEAATAWRRP
jgi:hypothetical protein